MPNWVTNFIELEGDEKRIAEMKESIKKDDFGLGTIDFNKLIPMPKELDIVAGSSTDKGLKAYSLFAEIYQLGTKRTKEELLNIPEKSEQAFLKYKKNIKPEDWELGRQAYRNVLQYGYPTWYEWACNNWGTKWNSCGYTEDVDYNSEPNRLWLQTAWSAPHPILQKLSEQYPDIKFTHEWADEDLGSNCGRRVYFGGECVETYLPETNKEALEMAARIWELDLEDCGLRPNASGTDYVYTHRKEFGLIQVFDKYALYTNERLTEADIPQGTHLYHCRYTDDNERIGSIEKSVQVNHAGSVITKEPIDFGGEDHITFTKDTEPCFLCQEITMEDYLDNYDNLEELYDQDQGMGGMTQ